METNIAIRGHKTRGKEVIQALEKMGGKNDAGFDGSNDKCAYYVRHDYMISIQRLDAPPSGESYALYTIEEYEGYLLNSKAMGTEKSYAKEEFEEQVMSVDISKIPVSKEYAQRVKESFRKDYIDRALKQYEVPTGDIKLWDLPDGYEFQDENGNVINASKIVLAKKKMEYPKTYDECCKILNIAVYDLDILDNMLDTTEIIYRKNLDRLLNLFRKLLICRDAYWKTAGDWKPDWTMYSGPKHCIIYSDNQIKWQGKSFVTEAKVLAFPTDMMRDFFYENFKDLIEECKELI